MAEAGAVGDPFAAAIRAGQYDFLCHLLPKKKKLPDRFLRLAATAGNERIVYLLLKRGADPDPRDHWKSVGHHHEDEGGSWEESWTPLLLAAQSGHAGIVGQLLDAGASASRRLKKQRDTWDSDNDDRRGGYDHALDFESCDSDERYETVEAESALDLAAGRGHVDAVKAITQRKPSLVNRAGPASGYTALHYAAKHRRIRAIDALIEAGADVDSQAGTKYGTALHVAVRYRDRHREATIRSLVRHGADVESKMRGITPLGLAVQIGNVAAATCLVAAGADVSESLFIRPKEYFEDTMVRALVRLGADVNARGASDGNTPLHVAAKECHRSWVDELLKAGADETALNNRGEIPADMVRRPQYSFSHRSPPDAIRALLSNAPTDRANRAWSRRGFFMLCRTFPGRVRLQPGTSEGKASAGSSRKPCGSGGPSGRRAKEKGPARAAARDGGRGGSAGDQANGGAAAFRTAMVRFMQLEADVVFRKIVEFL